MRGPWTILSNRSSGYSVQPYCRLYTAIRPAKIIFHATLNCALALDAVTLLGARRIQVLHNLAVFEIALSIPLIALVWLSLPVKHVILLCQSWRRHDDQD